MIVEYTKLVDQILVICAEGDEDDDDGLYGYGSFLDVDRLRLPAVIQKRIVGNSVSVTITEYLALKVGRSTIMRKSRRACRSFHGVSPLPRKTVDDVFVASKRQLASEDTTDSLRGAVKRVKQTIDEKRDSIRQQFFPDGTISRDTIEATIEEKKAIVELLKAQYELAQLKLLHGTEYIKPKEISPCDYTGVDFVCPAVSSDTTSSWADICSISSNDMNFAMDFLSIGSLSNGSDSLLDFSTFDFDQCVIGMENIGVENGCVDPRYLTKS